MKFSGVVAALAAFTLTICLLGCGGDVTPSQRYRIIDLGTLSCIGNTPTNPACNVGRMNDWCEVVGWDVLAANGVDRAFVWRPAANGGTPTRAELLLPTLRFDPTWDRLANPQPPAFVPATSPFSTDVRANDINNHGEVIGLGSGPRNEAILWATHGGPERTARTAYLSELPTGGAISVGDSINDEAQMSGSSAVQAGVHGIYFSSYDGMRDLGDLSHTGPDMAEAFSIAEGGGHIAGVGKSSTGDHAVYWNLLPPNTPPRDLGDLPGGANTSRANAVNRGGVVVGQGSVPNGSHAFRWEQSLGMQDLGDLAGGAEASAALDIKDTWPPNNGSPAPPSDIVGFGTNASGQRAVGWQASTTGMSAPIDLNTLVDPNDPLKTTAVLEQATSINRIGVIAVRGRIGGVAHVFLLVPADADINDPSGRTPFQRHCTDAFATPLPW